MLPAYLRPACVTEAGAIIYGKSSLLLSKPQDLLCRGNQQPGADHHSLLHRKLDPNAPEENPDKRFLGVGLVRRGSVITPHLLLPRNQHCRVVTSVGQGRM